MVDVLSVLSVVALWTWRVFCVYASLILVVPLASIYQEHQIWSRSDAVPSLNLIGYIKVYLFNVLWMFCTFVGSLLLLPMWLLGGNVEDLAHSLVESYTAKFIVRTFIGPVQMVGQQHLPPNTFAPNQVAPVYIANHSSQIDAGTVYYFDRKFKWIAKRSVLYLPGVGSIMYMAKHVFINRKRGTNQKSVSDLYEKSNAAVQSGTPMFIFPQGTRRISERLAFKDGAFNIALANQAPIVCVSINVPMTAWNDWYPLNLLWGGKSEPMIVTVHPPIQVKGTEDKMALKKQCFEVIYSVLPEIGDTTSPFDEKKKTK